jgi:hypothetical protein
MPEVGGVGVASHPLGPDAWENDPPLRTIWDLACEHERVM